MVEVKQNELAGRHFMTDTREYVITWNDGSSVRATPLDCPTGLTSMPFSVRSVQSYGTYLNAKNNYRTSSVCGNCKTEIPKGCGGLFKSDGKFCRLNLVERRK